MNTIQIALLDKAGTAKAESEAGELTQLVYKPSYKKGDTIRIKTDGPGFCVVRLEDTMAAALVYISGRETTFPIPCSFEKRMAYSPRSFKGKRHFISAEVASEKGIYERRNVALNPYDTQAGKGLFPHASANIETRGQSVFAARNVIDGILANVGHGFYPYQSWGINKNPEAELRIDFGVPVTCDEIRLTLRADFPHDNYWTEGTLQFSDGSSEVVRLEKTTKPQSFSIAPRTVEWLKLGKLIQAEGPSPFPALTQLEVYGVVAKG